MNEPTQEQIKEFWEWCGIKWQNYSFNAVTNEKVTDACWIMPDGTWHFNLPTIDLNNLFKYAVPFLLDSGYNIEYYNFKQTDRWYYAEANVWRKGSKKHSFEILHDEHIAKHFEQGADLDKITALALFWALKEVIDEQ